MDRTVERAASPKECRALAAYMRAYHRKVEAEKAIEKAKDALMASFGRDKGLKTVVNGMGRATLDEHENRTLDAKALKESVPESVWSPFIRVTPVSRLMVTVQGA